MEHRILPQIEKPVRVESLLRVIPTGEMPGALLTMVNEMHAKYLSRYRLIASILLALVLGILAAKMSLAAQYGKDAGHLTILFFATLFGTAYALFSGSFFREEVRDRFVSSLYRDYPQTTVTSDQLIDQPLARMPMEERRRSIISTCI